MSQASTALEFIRSERDWVSAHLVCCELAKFGRLMPETYPVATVDQWREIVDALDVERDGRGNVRVKREVKEKKQEGWLF